MTTEEIREWLITSIFNPLRGKGEVEIKLRAGSIHDVLRLNQCQPTVCNALRSLQQHTDGVTLIAETPGPNVTAIPPNGRNVWYTYQID